MLTTTRSLLLRSLFIGFILLHLQPARGQAGPTSAAPHGYDFLTVTEFEGRTKNRAKLLITPAFQGKIEVQLEDLNGTSLSNKDMETIRKNTLTLNQQLSELTTAGWELIDVHAVAVLTTSSDITRYLFRKAKP